MAIPSSPADLALADTLTLNAVRLTRWLRAVGPSPTLSGPQASALGVVVHSGRIRMSDLAQLEAVSRPTITRIATDLLALGLIDRTTDPADARIGWLATGQAQRLGPLVAALDALSPQDRAVLAAGATVLDNLIARAIQT